MEIRVLTGADAEPFRRFRLQALEQEPQAFGESAAEHQALTLETLAARLSPSGNFVLGAFDDGRLIGTAGFFREARQKTGHKGRIWGVYVTPEWRAKRVGRALLAAALKRARSQAGLEQIVLTVNSQQTAARRLYLSLGFEIFGHERHALKIGDAYVDEDYMVLTLC
jgi:RimJ/RimL family protein N-acetyltransferase